MQIHFQKPSKKIIIFGSAVLAVLLTITILKFWNFGTQKENLVNVAYTSTPGTSGDAISGASMLDTDKDGLPDWQEALLGTDLHKSDTDGDGTLDGKEVELSRDPNLAGPNDQNNKKTSAGTDAGTISESVSRNLFANSVYLSNTSKTDSITEDNKNALVNDLISGIQKAFIYNEYSTAGLHTISNENTETYRFYASSLATLQVGMILQMQKNISKIESNIGVLGEIYAKQAVDLYSLDVPRSLVDVHTELVNNFSKAAAVFEVIKNEKTDPLKLPFAIKTYQEIIASQPVILTQIAQFIKDNGIIFTSDEAGRYWEAFGSQ